MFLLRQDYGACDPALRVEGRQDNGNAKHHPQPNTMKYQGTSDITHNKASVSFAQPLITASCVAQKS
jgi:hypothetical protein